MDSLLIRNTGGASWIYCKLTVSPKIAGPSWLLRSSRVDYEKTLSPILKNTKKIKKNRVLNFIELTISLEVKTRSNLTKRPIGRTPIQKKGDLVVWSNIVNYLFVSSQRDKIVVLLNPILIRSTLKAVQHTEGNILLSDYLKNYW